MQKLLQGPNSWDIAQACFLVIFTFSSRKKRVLCISKITIAKDPSGHAQPNEGAGAATLALRPFRVGDEKSCQAMEEKMEAMRQEMGQDVALQAALAVRKLKWQVAQWFD